MLIIIGLGNPGRAYENTYHNSGFLTLDSLAQKLDTVIKKKECSALTAHIFVNGEKVILAKPQTYMNLSGKSVWELSAKYKAERKDLMVVYDDIDLPAGVLRFREEGRPGTHNGMKDITERIGTSQFRRLRIGIGAPPAEMDLAGFVTSRISALDGPVLKTAFDRASDALLGLCRGEDFQSLMRKYN